MSRFKLFGLMAAMMAAVSNNKSLTDEEKSSQRAMFNSQSGGYLFGSFMPQSSPYNQRKRRKLERQVPQRRKK